MVEAGALHSLLWRTVLITFSGLAIKALCFLFFFLWAQESTLGAAALRGAVAADLFTWAIFSLLEWQFRRFQITTGAIFELVLLFLYFHRQEFFAISGNIQSTAMSVLFFFLVMVVKTGFWTVDHVLEVTGVKEPAST